MINKNHVDYPLYLAECESIREMWKKELSLVEIPKIKTLDGPTVAIDKKYAKKIKDLQQKYKHLFTD